MTIFRIDVGPKPPRKEDQVGSRMTTGITRSVMAS
jgi:hypothetical protein